MQATAGIHAEPTAPAVPRAKALHHLVQAPPPGRPGGAGVEVTVFPTCFIEYMEPAIASRSRSCPYDATTSPAPCRRGTRCCGAPWLRHRQRRALPARPAPGATSPRSSAEVRAGRDVVVAQPTCGYVIRKRTTRSSVPGPDAELVRVASTPRRRRVPGEHAPARGRRHRHAAPPARSPRRSPTTRLPPTAPRTIGIEEPRPDRRSPERRSPVVERCSAIDGTWGLRAANVEMAHRIAAPLMDAVRADPAELVAGDCHLANTAIREATMREPVHPVQVLARAYGLEEA